jgi:hypothetical protein
MSGTGDRLFDVRQRPTFQIDNAAIAYMPRIGPAAWAVYCYLLARAAEGEARWPDLLTIATACGISTYNAGVSLRTLMESGLIARHAWTTDPNGPATFAIVPVAPPEEQAEPRPGVEPSLGTDRLVSEDAVDEEAWRREALERNETRELFSRFLEALGVDPGDLSERARTTVTEASRLARAAGATPDDVSELIERVRREQPDMVLDAERMLEYWNQLFQTLDEENNGGESE